MTTPNEKKSCNDIRNFIFAAKAKTNWSSSNNNSNQSQSPSSNEIREVSNDPFFNEPEHEHHEHDFDLNDQHLSLLTQQLCETNLLENQEVEYNTHLSQEDIYECNNDVEMRLAQSDGNSDDDNDDDDNDDDDNEDNTNDNAIDDSFRKIQKNKLYKYGAKRQKRNPPQFQDTVDKYFLQNGKVFKKLDAFRHPTKPNFFYKIEKLFKRNSQNGKEKMATCTVFRKRSETLLGDFLNDIEFVKYNHTIEVLLKELGEWTTKAAPVTKIYYDDSNKMSRSHGFNVVFLIAKHNKTFLTKEQMERIKKNKQEALIRAKKRLSQSPKTSDIDTLIDKIKDRPTCFEAFAGCGGMTIGFTNAGFDVKWAVDKNHAAAHSHERYHPCCRMFNEDIVTFIENFKKGVEKRDPEYEEIRTDHVHGSPPCQGFSDANPGGKNDEKNNESTRHFIELVRLLKPRKSVSYENVTGLLADENIKYLQMLISELIKMGFNTRIQVLNSARCGGDAQNRNRVFVTAWRCELVCVIPRPADTHSQSDTNLPNLRTAADAIRNLVDVEPCAGEGRVRYIDKDGNYSVTYNHTFVNNDINKVEDELIENRPSRTIRRQRPVKHYSKPRCLTVRERARLQSFPDDFVFRGTLTNQRDQIGNAVPIGLATEVAKVIFNSCYAFK